MKHTQLTDDLQEQASLYAAGAMTDSERTDYARHLADDDCAVCKAEVQELQAVMPLMAFSAPPAVPSPAVRERLMAQARAAAERSSSGASASFLRRWWIDFIAVAAAVSAIVLAVAATHSNTEMRRMT